MSKQKPPRRRPTNFRIDEHLMDALEAVRDRDGIPVSEQVRRGIELWLKSKGIVAKAKTTGRRA